MPLTKIQSDILRLLASQRDSESYVAGSVPLNREAARYSKDIDIFHDRIERLAEAVAADTKILESNGYTLEWLRQIPMMHSARVLRGELRTRLEWVVDSDYRFFPAVPDAMFGYMLHPVDLAVNKVMAAAGRSALKDLIDLLTVDRMVLPLGAVIWAAVDKSPGFTPEALIGEIRRNSNFPKNAWEALATTEPLDPVAVFTEVRAMLMRAEEFVSQMPSSKAGLLFLESGKVVQPDPSRLDSYATHAGQRRGHWPSSAEIANAMLDRYTTSE